MSEQKSDSFFTEDIIKIINSIKDLIKKNNAEEFSFSSGIWGKHWIKISFKKGKKDINIKTGVNKNGKN